MHHKLHILPKLLLKALSSLAVILSDCESRDNLNLHNQKIEGRRVEYTAIFLNSNPYVFRAKEITNSLSSSLLISAFYSLVHNLSIMVILTIDPVKRN